MFLESKPLNDIPVSLLELFSFTYVPTAYFLVIPCYSAPMLQKIAYSATIWTVIK